MATFAVTPLTEATWPDFAGLVERHHGVCGGCWCMNFHPEGIGRDNSPAQNRAEKEGRVRAGQAHAALVFTADDDAAHDHDAPATAACVGWCQFGTPDELPRIKHQRSRAFPRRSPIEPSPDPSSMRRSRCSRDLVSRAPAQ